MAEATNVDLPAIQGVVTQLGALSTSLGQLVSMMGEGSDLTWTGTDKDGTALYEGLLPAEQGGLQTVKDTKDAIDGVINSLGTTVGLWNSTEGTNIELNH